MGRMVHIYLHGWLIYIYIYGKLVYKYASVMDPSWVCQKRTVDGSELLDHRKDVFRKFQEDLNGGKKTGFNEVRWISEPSTTWNPLQPTFYKWLEINGMMNQIFT